MFRHSNINCITVTTKYKLDQKTTYNTEENLYFFLQILATIPCSRVIRSSYSHYYDQYFKNKQAHLYIQNEVVLKVHHFELIKIH